MTHTFTLTITLSEPAALTEGSSDAGGGHTTLSYIPGTSILGACVGALGINPGTALFAKAFLSSSTRFLNAYPSAGSARTLPRPLTFRIGKISKRCVHDAIDKDGAEIDIETIRRHFADASPTDTMKSTRAAMIDPRDPGIDCSPKRIEQVHVGIDRNTRTAADGVLFTYEAVRGGAVFIGAIETDDAEVAALLSTRTTLELRLGRSRSAGYGRALVALAAADDWREYGRLPRSAPPSTIITLLSDYLPHLECAPVDAIRDELATVAGMPRECIMVRAASHRKVRGFRGVWGLPRPARTALAKGSVLVIDATVDPDRLAAALARGVGARTNEGFGRLAIDWQVHGERRDGGTSTGLDRVARLARPKLASGNQAGNPVLKAIAARRSDRLMHEFVAMVLESKRATDACRALLRVPPSQLGNLRTAVSGSMSESEIGSWFRSLGGKTAGERWKRARIPSLLEGEPPRAGHAFVWQSLLGGEVSEQDRFGEGEISIGGWKTLVRGLAKSIEHAPAATTSAAESRAGDTVRLIIAGLVSNTARLRSERVEVEA